MSRESAVDRPWRIPRTGLIAAIVTFLILGSSGVAYAYWSASAALTSSAKAGSISVTLAGITSMQNTFANNVRARTGSITINNTSSTTSTTALPVTVGLGIATGGSTVLASNLDVTLWGPVAAASCTAAATPSGTIKTGTWASFSALSTTLAAGQSSTWCVRTVNAERSTVASASGSLSIQPKVTATMTAGTWTATTSATTTQDTQYIYPAAIPSASSWFSVKTSTGACLEVPASGGAGTAVTRASCSVVANQAFQFTGAGANGYLTITPKHNLNIRVDNGGSTTAGSAVSVQSSTGSASQSWQLQQVSAGVYQLVNKNSGLCVAPGAGSSTVQAVCDGSATQRFTLTAVTFPMSLVCTNDGNNGSKGRVTISWSAGAAGTYTVQADHDTTAGVNWRTIATSAANATSVYVDGTLPSPDTITDWAAATYDVRVLDSSGTTVATTSILVRNSGGFECG